MLHLAQAENVLRQDLELFAFSFKALTDVLDYQHVLTLILII